MKKSNLLLLILFSLTGTISSCGSKKKHFKEPPIVEVPEQEYQHLIISGQSLSTGHQSYPGISTENVPGNYMLGKQVWINYNNSGLMELNPLRSTAALSTQSLPKTRASQLIAECPLIGMVNHLQLKTEGINYIATSAGQGGKTIEELSKESLTTNLYDNFQTAINEAFKYKQNITCPAIVWLQGENNYLQEGAGLTPGSKPTADKNEDKSLIYKLKNNMQGDIKAKYSRQAVPPLFITYQVGAQFSRGKELNIGMAQLEASNENADIVCAGPVYPMTDRGGHLDPNGYRWFGEMLAKVYYKTKIEDKDFRPFQPKEILREAGERTLRIKYCVPVPPLVLDELLVRKVKDFGFEVYNDDEKQTISDINIENNSVLITCSSKLSGKVELVYAGTNNNGHGNLRDSDPYQALYNYVDLDEKKDGVYVYERDAAETTLRPSYEPKDGMGVIYNKPYPLHNFSVAFYYRLNVGENVYKVSNIDISAN